MAALGFLGEVPWVQAVPAASPPCDTHGQLPARVLGPATAPTLELT